MFWSKRKRGLDLPKGCKDLGDVFKVGTAKKIRARRRKPLETNEEVREVLLKYIPELADGSLEIVSTARVVGKRCLIVVRPTTGKSVTGRLVSMGRGPHLTAMIDELGGEFPSLSVWNESTEEFVRGNFMSPEFQIDMNPDGKRASVTLNMAVFEQLHGGSEVRRESFLRMHSEMVQLVSEVTGWRISMERV